MKKNWKRKLLSLWLSLVMVLSLTVGMSIVSFAAEDDIVILYTNDVHCGVDDNVGYASLALYKKQMEAQTPNVMLIDAGDAIQGAPVGTLSDGGYIIEIMNQMGYDFAIPGNHEYDYGMPRFLELAKKLNCGYTSCNFMDLRTGKPVFDAYRMFTFGNTKIAMVGVTTPESFTKSTPKYFQDDQGNYIYGFCEDESGEGLYTRVQESVDAARQDGADIVILVAHLGENGVTERWSSDEVIARTTGIDACIDGHSHEQYSKEVKNKDGEDVLLTQTGTKLASFGKLTIGADGKISDELITEVAANDAAADYTVKKGDTLSRIAKRELGSYYRWNEIYEVNKEQLKDPDLLTIGMTLKVPGAALVTEDGKAVDYETDRFIKNIQSQFEESLKTVIGHTDVELTVNNPETGEREVRRGETNLGDLAADAYRVVMGADIGLINGGGLRSGIGVGDITYQDSLNVFPFGNMTCLVEVTGQQLKDCLEMGAKAYPEEDGEFMHVSGVTYTIDTSIPSHVERDDKGNFKGVNGDYRVTDITVGGEPLDINKTYTLASHSYALKNGGGGMSMFKGVNILRDETVVDVDLLAEYIRDYLDGNVGSEYADPKGEGRVTIK